MSLSKNLNAYNDIKAVLDPAIEAGGGRYRLPSVTEAHKFRARAYQFRKLAQAAVRGMSNVPGYAPSTIYDNMMLRLDGTTIIIDTIPQPSGELTLPGGAKLRPKIELNRPVTERPVNFEGKAPPPEEDILTEAALSLLATEGKEEKK